MKKTLSEDFDSRISLSKPGTNVLAVYANQLDFESLGDLHDDLCSSSTGSLLSPIDLDHLLGSVEFDEDSLQLSSVEIERMG